MGDETPIALAQKAAGVLAERGIENARLDAELLLAAVLGIRRLDLYLQHERPLRGDELEAYRAAVRRRLRREPLQYIIGSAAFRHLEVKVDARALIPRPETELLVGAALEWAVARRTSIVEAAAATVGAAAGAPALGVADATAAPPPLTALEIGTGTAAIALSLVREGGFDRVVATDSSADAVALACENVARYELHAAIEVRHGATWDAVHRGERFAAIVSNPPYIAEAERALLAPEVCDYEPAIALFGGEDGLAVLDAIVDGAAEHLEAGGLLALEVGITQPPHVVARLERTGRFEAPRVIDDLTGRPRIVTAVLAAERETA